MTDSVLTEGGSDSAERGKGGGRKTRREGDREDEGRRGCPC